MKILLHIGICIFSVACLGQESGKFKIGPEFNSVFQNLSTGEFGGTINGVLFISNENNEKTILDFQAGNAKLTMVTDHNMVYDVSTKLYTGHTTSGKTKIFYSTYSGANKLTIVLSSGHFTAGSHDGASDMVINGVNYVYQAEREMEYLVVTTDRDIKMDNFWWLRGKGHDPAKAHELKKEITLITNSSIVFSIKRK